MLQQLSSWSDGHLLPNNNNVGKLSLKKYDSHSITLSATFSWQYTTALDLKKARKGSSK